MIIYFYELVSVVDREHGEITDSTIWESGFSDAAIEKEQKVEFD